MDSEISNSSKLSFLPQDVLLSVFQLLPFDNVMSLYLCGDRKLNYRFQKGGVVQSLNIGINSRLQVFKVPQLASVLESLQEATINLASNYHGSLHLHHLPRSLLFLQFSTDLWPASLYTDHTMQKLLPAKDLWPELRSFVTTGASHPIYPPKFIFQLPSTITKLHVPLILYEDLPSLPTGLLDLYCTFNMPHWPIEGHKLPNSLTKFHGVFTESVAFLSYPPNLLAVEINWSRPSIPDWTVFDPDIASTEGFNLLPRNLESLATTINHAMSTTLIKALPPMLTSLKLIERNSELTTEFEWLLHLPRGLTTLSGTILNGIRIFRAPYNASVISEPRPELIRILSFLPRSLTCLPSSFTPETLAHPDEFKALPPSLTQLTVRGAPIEALPFINALPLTDCSITYRSTGDLLRVGLPEQARRITVVNSANFEYIWPKSLTTVRLNVSVDMDPFDTLPPTVTELTGVIQNFKNSPVLRNLTRLRSLLFHIQAPDDSGLYGQFLQSLSPSLQILALIQPKTSPGSTDLFSSISHISSLRALHIMRVVSEVTESDIMALPRSLTVIRIKEGINKFESPERLVSALPPKSWQVTLPPPNFRIPFDEIERLKSLASFTLGLTQHELFETRKAARQRLRDDAALLLQSLTSNETP